jgi:NADH-quinone oxidoreductase subunit J
VSVTLVAFWAFASVAIASAVLCITRRSPVASALWLVNTLFSLAAIYVLLDAHFIAAAQVLVYAGAIMVLFLFVIMLLNLGRGGPSDIKGIWGKLIAGLGGLALLALVVYGVLNKALTPPSLLLPPGSVAGEVQVQGAVRAVARPLFQGYLVPFEITSVLLLAAIVGAVVLAKRRL